jgi:hypothetical protein
VRLVHGHVLDADAMILAADVNHAVDQKKRVTMRQQPQFPEYRRRRGFLRSSFVPFDFAAGELA